MLLLLIYSVYTLPTAAIQTEHQFSAQQPQSEQILDLTQEVPHEFSEVMSDEQLESWLSHQPVLLGTGYFTEIAEVIRGILSMNYSLV